MITAIILARQNSSRMPNKHFKFIGNLRLIDYVIKNLKKNKIIKEIILATGKEQNNKIFFKLKEKYKFLKIYYHKNDERVTERIYHVTKNIKHDYTLVVSGDCCLIDNSFIIRLFSQLKFSGKDFIKSNTKLLHEGLTLFRTEAWNNVNQMSVNQHYQEHPGSIVKVKHNKFDITYYKPQKYEIGKKFRISVDTKSDLDFFNLLYEKLKINRNQFNLKNVIKLKNIQIINNHVHQREVIPKIVSKIIIITAFSKKIGQGHMSRSLNILREINESMNSKTNLICLSKTRYNCDIRNISYTLKVNKQILKSADKIIIDLPKELLFKHFNFIKDEKKYIIIDNQIRNYKKTNFIIPSFLTKGKHRKNIFSGKNFLILNREINKINNSSFKIKYKKILLLSGSSRIDQVIVNMIKKENFSRIILGQLINNHDLKFLKNYKNKVIYDPPDLFNLIKSSKHVYCKFGVTALEVISLGKIPIIIDHDRDFKTKEDVNYLLKKGIISTLEIQSKRKSNKGLINIDQCYKNIIKIIK